MTTFSGVLPFAQALVLAAVALMACWNAYICLRLRPDAATVVINLAFWFVPVLTLSALSGSPLRSFALGNAITFVLQRIHWLKWKYLAATWTAGDLHMLVDRANWVVMRRYPFILGFTIVSLALLLLSWFLVAPGPPLDWKMRLCSAVLAAALAAAAFRLRDAHVFDPFGFNLYGHFANLVFSLSNISYKPPTINGDSSVFRTRASGIGRLDTRSIAHDRDLVVWLQDDHRSAPFRPADGRVADAGHASARRRDSRKWTASRPQLGRQHVAHGVRGAHRSVSRGFRPNGKQRLLHRDATSAFQSAKSAEAYDARHSIGYGLERTSLDRRTAARLSHYVSQMEATSNAAMRFAQDLLADRRPTVFAYFGDHQPNLGGRVRHVPDLCGSRYLTSYAIKTNFDPGSSDPPCPVLDVSFLAAVLLGYVDVVPNEFFAANRAMRLLCHGALAECPDFELLHSYKAHIFRDLRAGE